MLLLVLCVLESAQDFQKGVELFRAGELDAAVTALERAAQMEPKRAEVWKALGVAFAAKPDYLGAREPFHRACELNPDLADVCYYWARTLYYTDRYADALDVLGRLTGKDRGAWRTLLALAQNQEALGRNAEAEKNFRAALAGAANTDDKPAVAFATFLFRQGRSPEAIEPLRTILKSFPNSVAAHFELGRVLYQANQFGEASAELERAVRLNPADAAARLLLSKAYYRMGRDADGEREFETATQGSRTVR